MIQISSTLGSSMCDLKRAEARRYVHQVRLDLLGAEWAARWGHVTAASMRAMHGPGILRIDAATRCQTSTRGARHRGWLPLLSLLAPNRTILCRVTGVIQKEQTSLSHTGRLPAGATTHGRSDTFRE